MKRNLLIVAILTAFIYGCDSKLRIFKNCLSVTDVVTPSECYDEKKGLLLIAANVPESTSLQWVIAPLQDELGGTSYTPYKSSTRTNSIIIPDSIIQNHPIISVEFVAMKNCGSHMYFRFARQVSEDSTCTTWYLKEKGVLGD